MPTKIFQSNKIESLIFRCGGGFRNVENLPFLQLSAIMAETMQKHGILPPFCATYHTPPMQNIAIAATQKLPDCVSKPIGYLPSHPLLNTHKKRS